MKRLLAILVALLAVFVSKARGQQSSSAYDAYVRALSLVETIPLPGDGLHGPSDGRRERPQPFISGRPKSLCCGLRAAR